jgi:hypothetical protein
VISSLFGPRPRVNFVGGNTNLRNLKDAARQNVHPDITFNHGLLPFGFVINYYLSDTSVDNGTTELCLGSHRDTSYSNHMPEVQENSAPASQFGIMPSLLEERRKYAPPIYPSIPKGSVIIRDLGLWHEGVPNPSFVAENVFSVCAYDLVVYVSN